ncbi:TRAP transporter substrate-binding protein [Desulfocicer niacini]
MRKQSSLSVCLVCFIVAFGLFTGAEVVTAKTVNLTYNCFFPPTVIQSKLAESWCKAVEKKTNGEVKIAYYPGCALISSNQTFEGIEKGIADIGFSVLQYTRGRFPLMDFINLPLGYPSGPVATAILNEVYDKFQPKELDSVKVLYLHGHGPGVIHTKGKAIRTMDDLKGLKIRSHGPTAEMVKALGGTPIALPMPELYQALQKGVVDGGVWDFSASYDWKLAEVISNSTASYSTGYSLGFFVVMNKSKWEALSPQAQEAITKLNQEWTIKHGQAWSAADAQAMSFSLNLGKDLIGLDPREAEKWSKAVQPVVDAWLADTKSKNLPGEDVLKFVKKRLKDAEKGKFKSIYMAAE